MHSIKYGGLLVLIYVLYFVVSVMFLFIYYVWDQPCLMHFHLKYWKFRDHVNNGLLFAISFGLLYFNVSKLILILPVVWVSKHAHKNTGILYYFFLCVCLWWSIISFPLVKMALLSYMIFWNLILCAWISSIFSKTGLECIMMSSGFSTRFLVVRKWTKNLLDVPNHVLSLLYVGMHQIARYHLIWLVFTQAFTFSIRDKLYL